MQNNCALVLGGYVNGYSIIQELFEKNVENIILFDTSRKVASYSKKIKRFILIDSSSEQLLEELLRLHQEYAKIIIFPTDDLQLENLCEIYDKISPFCFLPFNKENLLDYLKKYNQYKHCEVLGIPFPKTIVIKTKDDIPKISLIQYPVLIKPYKRVDLKVEIFKNLQISSAIELEENLGILERFISLGIHFLASEIIPGDESNIYAYVAYRSQDGKILNEWTGKKLSQYPDDFGIFSSASNQAPEDVLFQGRILLNGMNITGIAEPEFKYDYRDGKYKLTEINLRSMMWHRVGNLSGVNIQYSQYLDALGKDVKKQYQITTENIHYVYLKHELINILTRKGYYKIFLGNIFNSDKTYFAVFDVKDIKPFLVDCKDTIDGIFGIYLKGLKHFFMGLKELFYVKKG